VENLKEKMLATSWHGNRSKEQYIIMHLTGSWKGPIVSIFNTENKYSDSIRYVLGDFLAFYSMDYVSSG
jgi:hypothetical protein